MSSDAELQIYTDYDYGNPGAIKKALQNLLQLHVQAEAGNTSSAAVWLDMRTALGKYSAESLLQVVTKRQKQALFLHLVFGYTEAETAKTLGISQQAVSRRILGGIRRIQRYLQTGKTSWTAWDETEIEVIRAHYATRGPQWVADHLERGIGEVYSKASRLRQAENLV